MAAPSSHRRGEVRRESGTPSHDQFGNLFAALDAGAFQSGFIAWVSSLTKLGCDIVAIDGITLRRSYQESGANPIHMISAFSSRQRLVLGQRKVADKSNEITAILELLDLLTVKGAIVTIDAMGCQKEIAKKFVEKEASDVLSHWAVESRHWMMDMVFRDDACRIRRDNAPANFATLEHIGSNLMRTKADNHSMRVKRRLAAGDDTFLAELVSGPG